MSNRENEILKLIKDNPFISQNDLSYKLGITRSGVATHIHNLTKKGLIKGRGYLLTDNKVASIVGGINIDTLGISSEQLITYNSNPGNIIQSLGGAGRNIALALTKLSISNNFISVYGDDINGDKFINNSHENNMDIECCERLKNERTSSFLYVINPDGKRYVGVEDMRIYEQITPIFLEKYIDKINQSKFCIIDTNISGESILYLCNHVNVPIIVKTVSLNKNSRLLKSASKIDILITTKKELVKLIIDGGYSFLNIKQATNLLLKMGIKNVIIFDVTDGLHYFSSKKRLKITKPQISVSNLNGSNAVFTSSLIKGLSQGLSWKDNLTFSYAAAIVNSQSEKSVSPNLCTDTITKLSTQIFSDK
ncbi:PfkB family carbohydrate kinase [Companilactobacillus sp. DQM5]|uniref:PfkB family carbohydrate kinase n=1 Tax=Companilactobacillus sp. DQM5 TaxID=3463359 RepID=UPI0040584086